MDCQKRRMSHGKNVATRIRQRKRSLSGGEIELSNRFSALGSKEEKQAENGVAKKKRMEANPCKREEGMKEIARDQSLQKNRDDVQGTVRDNIEQIHANTRKRQVYVIMSSILRRIDRTITRPDPETRRVHCLPGSRI